MTNRERWIVYPLLFYALAMGFKASYQDPLEFRCRTIECQQLNVRMINGSTAFAAFGPLAPQVRAMNALNAVSAGPSTDRSVRSTAPDVQTDTTEPAPDETAAVMPVDPLLIDRQPEVEAACEADDSDADAPATGGVESTGSQ